MISKFPKGFEEKVFPEMVKKWTKIGLSTGPIDIPKSKEIISKIYEAVELKAPEEFISFKSPLAAKTYMRKNKISDSFIYGNHNNPIYAYYETMKELGVTGLNTFLLHAELASYCGWWVATKNKVLLVENPTEIHFDDSKALHGEDGPSIKYSDGFSIYSWHGVRIPTSHQYIIKDKSLLTVDKITSENNTELRRVMREVMGEGEYLSKTEAKLIDSDMEGARKGAALRVLLEDNEERVFLVGTDGSTGRTYYMEVANTIKTCKEAHMSLCGFNEELILAKS